MHAIEIEPRGIESCRIDPYEVEVHAIESSENELVFGYVVTQNYSLWNAKDVSHNPQCLT